MRVGVVAPFPPFRGGIAQHAKALVGALCGLGHEVFVLSYQQLYPSCFFPGNTEFEPGDAGTVACEVEGVWWGLDALRPWTWVQGLARLHRADVERVVLAYWHPWFAPMLTALAESARRCGIEVVGLAHNVLPHDVTSVARTGALAAWAVRAGASKAGAALFSSCDRVLVQSEDERVRARSLLRGTKARPELVHVPHPRYEHLQCSLDQREARRELGLEGKVLDAPLLLFFGLVRPYKGLMVLLSAFAECVQMEGEWNLAIVGESYEDWSPYQERIDALGIASRVIRVPHYVSDLEAARWMAAANVLALPYLRASGSGVAGAGMGQQGLELFVSTEFESDGALSQDPQTRMLPTGDVTAWRDALLGWSPSEGRRTLEDQAGEEQAREEQALEDQAGEEQTGESQVRAKRPQPSFEELARVICSPLVSR